MAAAAQRMVRGTLTKEHARERTVERAPHLPALTSLRFFAALLVVMVHFGLHSLPAGPLHALALSGAVGVSFFFVLSGFILTYSYAAGTGSREAVRGGVRAFYWARFARIYPLYALAQLAGIALFGWHVSGLPVAVPSVPLALATFTLTQAWLPWWHFAWDAPGWSLAAEGFFYLLFPLLCPLVSRRSARGALGVLAGAWALSQLAPLCYLAVHPDGLAPPQPDGYWADVVLFSPLVHLPEFVAGIATAVLLRQAQTRGESLRWPGLCLGLALAVTGVALALSTALPGACVRDGLLIPLFAALLYVGAQAEARRGSLAAALAARPLVALGEASYALYVLHWLVFQAVPPLFGLAGTLTSASLAYFLACLCLSVALALLSCRLLETPARRALLARGRAGRTPARDGP